MAQTNTQTANVDNISNKVVKKVAAVEDVDPLELTPPLYEVIDPDALDQVFASMPTAGPMEGEVTFSYNGRKVSVYSDGQVSVQ